MSKSLESVYEAPMVESSTPERPLERPASLLDRLVTGAPGWAMVAAVAYAPWAIGAHAPIEGITLLDGLLAVALALWVLSCLWRWTWPRIHPLPALTALLLIGQSWWMAWNAKFDYNPQWQQFTPLAPPASWAPGSIDQSIAWPAAWRTTLLLGAACLIAEVAQRRRWRKRLLFTMALSGVVVMLFGFVQKVTAAPVFGWHYSPESTEFFATFQHHAYAGAFLNLIWPLTAAMLVRSCQKSQRKFVRYLWLVALGFCLAGAFANASRAANALTLGLLGLWIIWLFVELVRHRLSLGNATTIIGAFCLTAVLLGGLAVSGQMESSWRRWMKIHEDLSAQNPRLLVAAGCLKLVPQAGLLGFGPGTFETALTNYKDEMSQAVLDYWPYAHSDLLQALIEWGVVGTAAAALFLAGSLVGAWRAVPRRRERLSRRQRHERIYLFAMTTALVGVLVHSIGGAPFQAAAIQLYALVLAGILWAKSVHGRQTETH